MYRPRVLVAFFSAIVLAFAAAGCGGNSGDDGDSASRTTPDAWAATVCGTLGEWVADLQAESQELQPRMQNTRDLKSVKEAFLTFLQDSEESFGKAVEKVDGVRAPDVPNGDEIHANFVSALEDVEGSFSRAVDQANDLPTDDLKAFSTGVGKLSQDLQQNLAAAGQGFETVSNRSTELKDATDAEPACQQFKARS